MNKYKCKENLLNTKVKKFASAKEIFILNKY